jgi:hypothetical protein
LALSILGVGPAWKRRVRNLSSPEITLISQCSVDAQSVTGTARGEPITPNEILAAYGQTG